MKQKNVIRGLAGLSATLLAVSSAATAVAATRTDFINSKLGTSSFKLVEKGDGTGDSIYFDSEFSSVQDLIDAKNNLRKKSVKKEVFFLKIQMRLFLLIKQGKK